MNKINKKDSQKNIIALLVVLLSIMSILISIMVYMLVEQSKKYDNIEAEKTKIKNTTISADSEFENKKQSNEDADVKDINKNEKSLNDSDISKDDRIKEGNEIGKNLENAKEFTSEKILSQNDLKWVDDFSKTAVNVDNVNGKACKIYTFADIINGKFNGGKLKNLACSEMGISNNIYILLGDDIFVIKNADEKEYEKYYREDFSKAFKNKNIIFVYDLKIPAFEFDDEITFNYNGIQAYMIRYNTPFESSMNIVFDNKYLKKINYTHPKYGQAWISNVKPNTEDAGIFSLGGIYFKGPANTTYIYRLLPDLLLEKPNMEDALVKAVLDITWNDGTKNKSKYTYGNSGCGISSFVAGSTNKKYSTVKDSDLEPIGKTATNRIVYKLKSAHHPIVKEIFQKYEAYKNSAWIKEAVKKEFGKETIDTIEEFNNFNSIIVIDDIFGRRHIMFLGVFAEPAECGKPVIYLYPQKKMDVNVKVFPTGGFTKVEPNYTNNGWNVKAYPDGKLLNYEDNRIYPYLFWEGLSNAWYNQSKKGFVVKRNNLKYIFDKTLSLQNLNSQEISDFEDFWIPKMLKSNKPYFFVTFTTEDFINRAAPLKITPKPDTLIRVMMDYEPLDKPIEVQEMKFSPKERKGFTVIEWGGMLGK